MAKLDINFWDQDLDYKFFDSGSQPDYRQFLHTDWPDLIAQNDYAHAFDFLWSLRSILWPELIKSNELEIRFCHDGSSGDGYGPLIFFGNTSQIKDIPTKSLQTLESNLTLESAFFPGSDMFFSDRTDDGGFLGIQSLQIEFLSYEDEDEDEDVMFEHTFSADFRITDTRFHQTKWSKLSEIEQNEILDNLAVFALAQLDEYSEYVHEVTDLLATILVHPETHPQVIQALLNQLEKLKLGGLTAVIQN